MQLGQTLPRVSVVAAVYFLSSVWTFHLANVKSANAVISTIEFQQREARFSLSEFLMALMNS